MSCRSLTSAWTNYTTIPPRVTFYGNYPDADDRTTVPTVTLVPAITWGHNKDHRPDLKQLLYILTVSDDGGVPVYFQTASGNVVDDQTHQATWRVLAELVQRPDFVYVADCKLATTENMNEIARQGGRFITVLPATRKEDTQFRQTPGRAARNDSLARSASGDAMTTARCVTCFASAPMSKSARKAIACCGFTAAARWKRTARLARGGCNEPSANSPTSAGVCTARGRAFASETKSPRRWRRSSTRMPSHDFLHVDIQERQEEKYRQAGRGRPHQGTKYTRSVRPRFDVTWEVDGKQLDRAVAGDGVFPLITNLADWKAEDVLQAYKRQPIIEKRFSQLKTDFCVAPVYLKSVTRIVGLLAIYFFALMVQSLLERELRQAMKDQGVESLPLYPEGRACKRPTTRRVLDVFEPIARHTISTPGSDDSELFTTELAPIHRMILKLLRVPTTDYRE